MDESEPLPEDREHIHHPHDTSYRFLLSSVCGAVGMPEENQQKFFAWIAQVLSGRLPEERGDRKRSRGQTNDRGRTGCGVDSQRDRLSVEEDSSIEKAKPLMCEAYRSLWGGFLPL
ncbi:hypothetical protein SAMN02799630_03609 [Paenibacillus sp. UNCCL117]|uniref:hypothetical protein n=1 Tax=unclassified Paenibacillus TaxID=185978 RepID=UPI0008825D4C|nr:MULTISPECIES: hypothetical protein [unclassified Paenibacillus]SDD37479.1 hypothetical protein SAMN04488602_10810 [Paenibacillus sp. cl123]SFW48774.1 hypothetical protein SAMN02799630_03609 [Paenibacillus sp. UNCCL117]